MQLLHLWRNKKRVSFAERPPLILDSMHLTAANNDENGRMQFLFEDADFEDSNFHPASFVAKYRRVTSLESLRDQLRQYCSFLKDELYDIINRDYKDFITIATKLEGVDFRVEHLRKPLVDLRMDLTLLNDTMVISEKIRQREEVSCRRRVLESSIACMERLSDVEVVLAAMASPAVPSDNSEKWSSGQIKSRRDFIRVMNASRSRETTTRCNASTVSAMECSELERAAVALASARSSLREQMEADGTGASKPTQARGAGPQTGSASASAVVLRRSLESRLNTLLVSLEECIRPRIVELLTTYKERPHAGQGFAPAQKRSLGHLLRALAAVDKGSVAETLVAEQFTVPLTRLYLTQGRVDGIKGRGSYSGLQESLEVLLQHLSSSLQDPLITCEEVFHRQILPAALFDSSSDASLRPDPPPVDLFVGGVVQPILTVLATNFPAMFGSGIASVFHTSYCAIEDFLSSLFDVCGSQWTRAITTRVNQHHSVVKFRQMWKLDLHFQLRCQEIRSRLDAAFEITSAHGLCSKVFDDVYAASESSEASESTGAAPRESGANAKPSRPVIHMSLPLQTITTIEQTLTGTEQESWNLSITKAVVTEVLTCLHPDISLKLLGAKFVQFLIKILILYQTYILNAVGYRYGTSLATFASGDVSNVEGTPQKVGAIAGGSGPVGVDDLWLAICDSHALLTWVEVRLVDVAERTVLGGIDSSSPSPIRRCLAVYCRSLAELPPVLWAKMSALLTAECRAGLKAVKSVAGKYRMTNKPPPDAPSSFVAAILNPLQLFLDKYGKVVSKKLPLSSVDLISWNRAIVESVTSSYRQHVQELMETAQQMDNALQRRSKLRQGTPGAVLAASTTDSEKIAMQMLLDVQHFGTIVRDICNVDPMDLQSYQQLLNEVMEGKRIIESK